MGTRFNSYWTLKTGRQNSWSTAWTTLHWSGIYTSKSFTITSCKPRNSLSNGNMDNYTGSTDPAVASLDSSARVLLTTVTHKLLPALSVAKLAVDGECSTANVNWADVLVSFTFIAPNLLRNKLNWSIHFFPLIRTIMLLLQNKWIICGKKFSRTD